MTSPTASAPAAPPVAWPAVLTTERLVLRPVERADVPAVTRLWTDPEVRRHLGGPVAASVVRIRQRRCVGARGVFVAARADDGAVVGLVTVGWDAARGEREVSYQFLPEHWGRGYAREAVAVAVDWALGTSPTVIAVTQEANARSRRLLEAVGLAHVESFVEWDAHQVLYRTPG
ncbi:GNAT family N-acetyltransferase [Streptomyces sp. NPDC048604]|uniref:GNAT family N-acetyltransferase n=1 Tax=Streptomyces sp. NPDC048604 TaxID=3365578 RepID=UPI00371E481D